MAKSERRMILIYDDSMRPWCVVMVALYGCARAPEPPRGPPRKVVGHLDGEPLYAADGGVLVLGDGGAVAGRGPSGWRPLTPPSGRLELDDGSYWVALGFAASGAARPEARWVMPAHARAEVDERKKELAAEAEKLPPPLRARVEPELELMALISTLEGRFADPATHAGDTAASLGIFQWATARRGVHTAGTTLGRFFSTLSKRASEGGEPLFTEAWAQCTKLGLRIVGGDLFVGKRALSGAELEKRFGLEMGRGALRTYQLVAAADWIDDVKNDIVRPGVRGANAIGHDYAEAERGRLVTLTLPGHTLEVRPGECHTVGEFFSGAAMATAVSLGVNRPRYVETALWQARTGLDDARVRVDELLGKIVPPPDKPRFSARDLSGDSLLAYAELQALLWPAPLPAAPNGDGERGDAALERAFAERALALYKPDERERRARRLATGK
jgi:hypothetical protein